MLETVQPSTRSARRDARTRRATARRLAVRATRLTPPTPTPYLRRMPSAVIFDVDGTLVDTVDLHAAAWQEALRDFGYDVPLEDVRAQIGKGGDQLMPVFVPAPDLEKNGEALEQHRSALYEQHYLPRAQAFPGVRDLFEQLRDAGLRIAVASSANEDELGHYLRLANADELVPVRTARQDAEKSKPHPDIFAAALERLGLGPDEVVVVGDSPWDAEAAGKLGLATVGLRCGGFSDERLREAGVRWLYDDPAHLARDFERSPLAPARDDARPRPADDARTSPSH